MSQDWQFWIVMSCVLLAAASIVLRCWRAINPRPSAGSCGGCHACPTGTKGTDLPLVQLDLAKPR